MPPMLKSGSEATKEPPKKKKCDIPRQSEETTSFAWDIAQDAPVAKRIALKETAVQDAAAHTNLLIDLLRQFADGDSAPLALKAALNSWIVEADETLQDHQAFQVPVGVVGQTGVGKTSLLNAILGEYELLPSGHDRAATSVCCKVAWNFDSEPGKECRAEVFFQDLGEIEQQIVDTIEAIRRRAHIANDTSYIREDERTQDAAEAAAEVKSGMDKIRAAWNIDEERVRDHALACDSSEDVASMTQRILQVNSALVKTIESGKLDLVGATTEDLAKQIKPYLDATTLKIGGEDVAMWPLIRNVNVYIKSEILRQGICLVDLPGVGDAVESRAKVASDFHKQLEVTMIVAAIQRAADERSTLRLLNDSQEMRARLTAGTNQHAFGVVLTKMDGLDVNSFVKRSKAVEEDEHVKKLVTNLEAAKSNLENNIRSQKFTEKENKPLRTRLRKLKKQLKQLKTGKKKKDKKAMQEEMKKVKDALQAGQHEIKSLKKRAKPLQESIDTSTLHLSHWATKTRNANVAKRMKEDFLRRQRRTALDASRPEPEHMSTLAVHATSSQAFWKVRNGNKDMLSAPIERYSGVPRVVQWIHEATAERREKHLDIVLHRLLHCMSGIDSWTRTCKTDLRINVNCKKLQDALKKVGACLSKNCQKELDVLFEEITNVNPFQDQEKARTKFQRDAKRTASNWQLKYPDDETTSARLAWKSYLAVVKRKGGPYTSPLRPDIEYDWIPKLYQPIILDMATDLTHFVNVHISSAWDDRKESVTQMLETHFNELKDVAKSFEMSLAHYINTQNTDVVESRGMIIPQVEEALNEFRRRVDVMDAAHVHISGILRECFEFMEREITGHDSYARRRDHVEMFVEARIDPIFNGTIQAMENEYKAKKRLLSSTLKSLANGLSTQVFTRIYLRIDNLLGKSTSSKKLTVQSQVQETLSAWRKKWQSPEVIEHVLSKDVSIPLELLNEDLKAWKAAGKKKKYDNDDSEDDDSSASSSDDDDDQSDNIKEEDMDCDLQSADPCVL